MDKSLTIFLVADTMLAGGAEWFVLRLRNNLIRRGHDVHLIVLRADKIDHRIVNQFPETRLVHANIGLLRMLLFFDRVFNKIFKMPFLFHRYSTSWLRRKLKKSKPDVIHSHLLAADIIAVDANKGLGIQHVMTIHGDYIEFLKDNNKLRIDQLDIVINAVDKIVVISEEQKKFMSENFPITKEKLVKIYNGYELVEDVVAKQDYNHFTFGMIARGTAPKGWAYAMKAFAGIENKNARLVFYGSGEYLEGLARNNTDRRVSFAGFTNDPLAAISTFDVGLFASYYPSESLPTTIIEYLVLHKPVLTTPVGECAKMIESNGSLAGAIIPMKEGIPDTVALTQLMLEMMNNKSQYQEMSAVAERAKYKFEMSKCIDSYLKVYKS